MGRFKHLATSVAVLFLGIQFLPLYPRTNPSVDPSLAMESQLDVHPQVAKLIDRSCRDCHSNNTKWPWYSRIAPAAWLIGRDVQKARAEMNFSEWTEQAGQKLEKAMGLLMASCVDVNAGRMPKPQYVFLHSEASLNTAEKTEFCQWSTQQGGKLIAIKRAKKQKERVP